MASSALLSPLLPPHTVFLRCTDSWGKPVRGLGASIAESCPLHRLENFGSQISFNSRLCRPHRLVDAETWWQLSISSHRLFPWAQSSVERSCERCNGSHVIYVGQQKVQVERQWTDPALGDLESTPYVHCPPCLWGTWKLITERQLGPSLWTMQSNSNSCPS